MADRFNLFAQNGFSQQARIQGWDKRSLALALGWLLRGWEKGKLCRYAGCEPRHGAHWHTRRRYSQL